MTTLPILAIKQHCNICKMSTGLSVPSHEQVLAPESVLKRRKTDEAKRQEKVAKAAELKKVSLLIQSTMTWPVLLDTKVGYCEPMRIEGGSELDARRQSAHDQHHCAIGRPASLEGPRRERSEAGILSGAMLDPLGGRFAARKCLPRSTSCSRWTSKDAHFYQLLLASYLRCCRKHTIFRV